MPDEPNSLRDRTAEVDLSRTWELELFISGGVVFALLQAPAHVDSWWQHTIPHLDGAAMQIAVFAYEFAKLILYALISTFVCHLIARSYWVGLVGLHSVFPHGTRWEKLSYGPIWKQVVRERARDLPTLIARVDDFCSVLFSFGALLVITFLRAIIFVAIAALITFLVGRITPGRDLSRLLLYILLVFAFVMVATTRIDRRRGEGIDPNSRFARMLRRIGVVQYNLGLGNLAAPLSIVLQSNLRKRTFYSAIMLVLIGLLLLFFVRDIGLGAETVRLETYDYLPRPKSSLDVQPDYYEDERAPDAVIDGLPSIQSQQIAGPYIELFVPIAARRDDPIMAERCPGLPKNAGLDTGTQHGIAPDAAVLPVLACLAGLQPVSLDGKPLTDLSYRLYTHPRSGIRGILAHIPTQGLARGEHLLRVEGLPRPRTDHDPPRDPHFIRFWL